MLIGESLRVYLRCVAFLRDCAAGMMYLAVNLARHTCIKVDIRIEVGRLEHSRKLSISMLPCERRVSCTEDMTSGQ